MLVNEQLFYREETQLLHKNLTIKLPTRNAPISLKQGNTQDNTSIIKKNFTKLRKEKWLQHFQATNRFFQFDIMGKE